MSLPSIILGLPHIPICNTDFSYLTDLLVFIFLRQYVIWTSPLPLIFKVFKSFLSSLSLDPPLLQIKGGFLAEEGREWVTSGRRWNEENSTFSCVDTNLASDWLTSKVSQNEAKLDEILCLFE
ncbi:hypothetical protein L1987_55813 [Smallanthus sonchifolius]|uniref:Uncharacterized protein n=1 Tax=Smallanthus sonchifolius TaxID=185202 RepID=A0ACB9EB42_9ASTR|nr:hypothetical protein L1987_55813 [Smallanthus sonchifolius]